MRLTLRRRIRIGRGRHLNVTRAGATASQRIGPLTITSGGRVYLRLCRGIVLRIK